jgi:hypothetical protein
MNREWNAPWKSRSVQAGAASFAFHSPGSPGGLPGEALAKPGWNPTLHQATAGFGAGWINPHFSHYKERRNASADARAQTMIRRFPHFTGISRSPAIMHRRSLNSSSGATF